MTDLIGLVVRWLTFAAILAAVGAVIFRFVVLGRAVVSPSARASASRRSATVGAIAASAIVPLALVRLAIQTSEMRFPDDPWLGVGLRLAGHTAWGRIWSVQVGAALLAIPAFAAARRHTTARWVAPAIFAAVLLTTPSLSSHAMDAHRLAGVSVAADLLHVLGAAAWLGALAVMFASIVGGDGTADGDGLYVAALLRAFSPLAVGGAALVVSSGLVSSLAHIEHVGALFRSRYGITLLAKLTAVLVVALFGWRNWKYITPRLAEDGPGPMRRSMAAELVAMAVVLLITAALVVTQPPMDAMTMP